MPEGLPTRPSLPATVYRHALMGTATAGLAGLVDGTVAAYRASVHPGWADALVGALSLVGMLAPWGLAAGLVVGVLVASLSRTAAGTSMAALLPPRGQRTAHAPDLWARGVAGAATLGLFLVATQRSALHFATRYHDPAMASWAMAATMVGVTLVAALIFAAMSVPLLSVARRLGRLASPVGLGVLLLLVAVAVPVAVFTKSPRLMHVFDWPRLLWGPGAALSYLVVWFLWPARTERLRGWRIAAGAGVLVLLVAGLVTWVGSSYGSRNRVRALVEQDSASGRALLRTYADFTDSDGDGHAFAFGGGDCNDHNARVHPGATDKPGDGVDSDCFAGDASPVDLDLSTGRYGTRPAGLTQPNFLVIGIDALRPDHLGCFGYKRDTSPRMDALCRESVRFRNTLAQSSRSIRSIPALFMGKYPSQIAFGPEYLYPSIRKQNDSIVESLARAGYATTAVMGTNYFDRVGEFFQGFDDVVQASMYKPPRDAVVNRAVDTLSAIAKEPDAKPWFMWVHLFHVHEPYLNDDAPSRFGNKPVDKYDTEINYADEQVGRLLDTLKKKKLDKNAVVILFSDHGEAFGEHQNRYHSYTLYDEELRATLMVRVPGVEPREVNDTVALFDLAPTVLNLADVPMPGKTPARSLVPLFPKDAAVVGPPRAFISELMPDGLFPFDQKAIRLGDHKLIWWTREGMYQYFNLAKDPGEKRDLSDDDRGGAAVMLTRLRSWVGSASRPDNRNEEAIDRQRLKAVPKNMEHRLDVRFAPGFTLLGYDMPKTSFRVGDRIPITFYYRVDRPISDNLFFYVDLTGPGGYRVHDFHAHHYPLNGRYGTTEWRVGEILRDPVEIVVPEAVRTPTTMDVSLAVLDPRKRPVSFAPDPAGKRQLSLGTLRIH